MELTMRILLLKHLQRAGRIAWAPGGHCADRLNVRGGLDMCVPSEYCPSSRGSIDLFKLSEIRTQNTMLTVDL